MLRRAAFFFARVFFPGIRNYLFTSLERRRRKPRLAPSYAMQYKTLNLQAPVKDMNKSWSIPLQVRARPSHSNFTPRPTYLRLSEGVLGQRIRPPGRERGSRTKHRPSTDQQPAHWECQRSSRDKWQVLQVVGRGYCNGTKGPVKKPVTGLFAPADHRTGHPPLVCLATHQIICSAGHFPDALLAISSIARAI